MKRQKLVVFLTLLCIVALLLPVTAFATEADASVVDEWHEVTLSDSGLANDFVQNSDGTWYFYQDGYQLYDCVVWSEAYQSYYILSPDGASHTKVVTGWQKVYKNWYYADWANGVPTPACGEIRKIDGNLYAFDYDYRLVQRSALWVDDVRYQAANDGKLYVFSWYYDVDTDQWLYFGAEGKALNGFHKIEDAWYFFEDGAMQADKAVWSDLDNMYFALSADGNTYIPLVPGWNQAFGEWYYLQQTNEGPHVLSDEIAWLNGADYYFYYNGQMMVNDFAYIDGRGYMFANEKGELANTGWFLRDGKWCYMANGTLAQNGLYEIDGKLYYFEGVELVTEPGIYGDYYITIGGHGVLYRNAWRHNEIGSTEEIGWVYYGDDGRMVRNEVINIGGFEYGFDDYGVLITSDVRRVNGYVYYFNAEGYCEQLKNGWHRNPETQEWLYVYQDDLAEGLLEVNGIVYGFEYGRMEYNGMVWGSNNGIWGDYLFDANGALITKAGWVSMEGEWYYLNEDLTLKSGWVSYQGKWYYCDPYTYELRHNEAFFCYEEGIYYIADVEGACLPVVGTGLINLDGFAVYIENSQIVTNDWRKIDGYWYFFNYAGRAVSGGVYTINDKLYLFDEYGKMQTGGWVNYAGAWYFADPADDGALRTGLTTVIDTEYLFSSNGVMQRAGLRWYDGQYFLLGTDGKVLLSEANHGWNKVGNDWYYVHFSDENSGELVTGQIAYLDGKDYLFGTDGKLLTHGLRYMGGEYYVIGEADDVCTGWHNFGGQWVYADPDYKCIVTGEQFIDDKVYIFDHDGFLLMGHFATGHRIYTTDADGAVIKTERIPDGWSLVDGTWYYIVDGEGYTGWLGDYYLTYGYMWTNDWVEYDGEFYYLTHTGKYLKNAWYEHEEDAWILAQANGALYCSEWVWYNGSWYYFDYIYMVADGIYYIDGKLHEFDEDGKWLGEYTGTELNLELGLADGWHEIGGKWYYYYCGVPCTGEQLINGKRYYFDYETAEMLTNVVEGDTAWFYFGEDGAAVEANGWTLIKGTWYFFNPDHTLYFGLVRDSVAICKLEVRFNEKTEQWECVMLKDAHYHNGYDLYYFNKEGYSAGPVSTNGWYQAGNVWYYFENGALAKTGYREINGVGYYFQSGRMVTEAVIYANGTYKYFNADGAMVTTAGWYQTAEGEWVYVRDSIGRVYYNGIYMINGVEYCFRYGYRAG